MRARSSRRSRTRRAVMSSHVTRRSARPEGAVSDTAGAPDRETHATALHRARTFRLSSGDAVLVGTEIGDGHSVMFLHAGGERRQVWDPVSKVLAQAGYRCVAFDQRGHGDSGGSHDDEFRWFV